LVWCLSPATGQVATGQHSLSVTIPEVVIMDIEPGNSSIQLPIGPPLEAGNPMQLPTNATKWINYTCALSPSATNKIIRAQITSGVLPPGVSLQLQAGAYTGSGGGTSGSTAGLITLSASPQAIITGIGRSYTGNGAGQGHQLTYSLVIANQSLLNFDTDGASVTVTFTISD
jgi:hypothetical protein